MQNIKSKISIIVPVYNVEKYLKECLDSLLSQTLKDIEIICVNDGSTDGSYQILEEYKLKDKRIKVIHQQNHGYGYSMNVGIDNATSDYIGILESDDVARPEMFFELYNFITEYECDLVKSDFYYYYSLKNQLNQSNTIPKEDTFKIIDPKKRPDLLSLLPSIWSAVYKKELLLKNNIRFLETPGASYQDTSFSKKVFMCADKIVLTDKAYVYYRQDNENSSINSKSKVYYIVDEYKELHSFLDSRPEFEVFRSYVYEIQFWAYLWNLDRISDDFVTEFFNFIQKEFKDYYDNHLLSDDFIKRINKKTRFDLFIHYPQKYLKRVISKRKFKKWKTFRRKILQVRLNRKEIKIKIFGKELISRQRHN